MTENYLAVQKALNLDLEDIRSLAVNAIQATFLGQVEKQRLLDELEAYYLDSVKTLPIDENFDKGFIEYVHIFHRKHGGARPIYAARGS